MYTLEKCVRWIEREREVYRPTASVITPWVVSQDLRFFNSTLASLEELGLSLVY